jgi:predicted MPP superfamily phosphohydrolase
MNQNKVIIIPDVHGRTFWRSVLENTKDTVVFLGDYCDPYPDEGITHQDCIRELTDILEFKKQNPERVILLLGNHDLSHMFPKYHTKCRWGTEKTQKEYERLYEFSQFQMAYECKQGDIKYLFTHAGATQGWLKQRSPLSTLNSSKDINTWWEKSHGNGSVFGEVGRSRGGYCRYGSCVWADISEHFDPIVFGKQANSFPGYYQIFGHTRIQSDCHWTQFIGEHWAMLDCSKVFILKNNIINEYKN